MNIPEKFNDPFRYVPHPEVVAASQRLIGKIRNSNHLASLFQEGKMIGVLWVRLPEDNLLMDRTLVDDRGDGTGFIYAFSGNVSGLSIVEGFVPPVFDLLSPGGYFLSEQQKITSINREIDLLEDSGHLKELKDRLREVQASSEEEISSYKSYMAECKADRDRVREVSGQNESFIKESQYQKAQLRRIRQKWASLLGEAEESLNAFLDEIEALKQRRRAMSDSLQSWIFSNYIVHNAKGESSAISDIFASHGLVPPGGTGDCAAPKLLDYAFTHSLSPIAMGEFWYGESSGPDPRTEGCFYPSCTSKCGPLLPWMLSGLDMMDSFSSASDELRLLYRDNSIVVVSKPSGMLSVPGRNSEVSAQEKLSQMIGTEVFAVHRLDMDTSGLLVFALDPAAQAELQRQFEHRIVAKTYKARLCASISPGACVTMLSATEGRISLPLSADYDNRPRQKADLRDGREAVTDFVVIGSSDAGTDVLFMPLTGRTHQLRVHAAHRLGLSSPIAGDRLYGGASQCAMESSAASLRRLYLHAYELRLRHPVTDETLVFRDDEGYILDSM